MLYRIVTAWQGEPEWEVLVMVPLYFESVYLAQRYIERTTHRLFISSQTNRLILDISGEHYQISSESVIVSKLKPESEDKIMISADDFERQNIDVKDFHKVEGLNQGFCSLSYGITDSNLNAIKVLSAQELEQAKKIEII